MNKYCNTISLGFFCSPAMEIEALGLRNASYPFDWLISTEFSSIIQLISNHFDCFLDEKYLYQDSSCRSYYKQTKYNIWFYHDFDKFKPFDKQFQKVYDKYQRRIARFYNDTKKPTLFLRYISDNQDLEYIENNQKYILDVLKKSNSNNDIVYISNTMISSNIIDIFKVTPDENDTVARSFFSKNIELANLIINSSSVSEERKNSNIKRFRRENSFTRKFLRKLKKVYNNFFSKEYIHNKTI